MYADLEQEMLLLEILLTVQSKIKLINNTGI